MAKGKGKGKDKGATGDPVAVIRGYTESVERIGADAALLGVIVIMGGSAMIAGADPYGVTYFGLGAYVLWLATKFINSYLALRSDQTRLDSIRVDRGLKILESHPDRQKRLSFRNEGKEEDV